MVLRTKFDIFSYIKTNILHNPFIKLLICLIFGLFVYIILPSSLDHKAAISAAVFFAVLLSFFLRPYPMGLTVLLALIILSCSHALTFKEALHGFSNHVVWLVVAAFMIAKVVIDSNLGKRMALTILYYCANSPIGIAYAICLSELLLSPVIASNTARGGGIISPIVNNIINGLGINAQRDPNKLGKFLLLTACHANLITSAMFLTAMAANPVISHYADLYLKIKFDWVTWAKGSIVPGLTALFLLPLFIKKLIQPKTLDISQVKAIAGQQLLKIGPMSHREKIVAFVFVGLIILWSCSSWHHLSTSHVAWMGVLILLLTNSMSWHQFIRNNHAWDTMIWLGGILTIVTLLDEHGAISYAISKLNFSWLSSYHSLVGLLVLTGLYFYTMYVCSMLTAHISAFLGGFFILCLNLKTPLMLTAGIFAYASSLCACLTHYSTGPVVVYFSYHYFNVPRWFLYGFAISIYQIVIWLTVGLPWWAYLEWW